MSTTKRREPKKASRKPVDKPKQFCMKITTKKSMTDSDKSIITDFVKNLYTNKKMDPEDFFVVMDAREKRVCIELNKKINANYLKLEDIHNDIKPIDLKVNSNITLSNPTPDIFVHHLDSTTKTKVPKGLKWVTLSHNGPYFTWIMEPYEPHGIPIIYDGKKYKLSPSAEQVANLWSQRITTDQTATIAQTDDKLFRENFWKDFKTYLSPENKKIMKDFDKFNFEPIRKELIRLKEAETSTDKNAKKKRSEEKKHDYGYAIVNGVKEKIGAFVPEPAGLFLGRGKNKLRGRVKRDINPSDVVINIDKISKAPKPPKGNWKEIVHDQKARWISKWQDILTGKPKYIYLSAESQFKSDSDAGKFENARKLNRYHEQISKKYLKDASSSNKETKQLATMISLVDQYGIRMGGEKGELEAKTYGASTLLVKHIKLIKPDKIHLDFLGKDSIRYDKTLSISKEIFDNISKFISEKSKNTAIFDLVNACDVNNYLKKFDQGLSGKVFRTRLGSSIMYNELSKIKIKKNDTPAKRKAAFIDANVVVAQQLNHQKTTTKASLASIEKMKTDLKELEKELKQKKKEGGKVASLEKRVNTKKDSILAKEKLTEINPGTSLTNYIDPRLVTAWAKANDVPIDKIYTKTLQNKFKWAIDDTEADWDWDTADLLPGFENLQPIKESEECPRSVKPVKPTKRASRKPPKIIEEEDSSDEEDEESQEEEEHDKPLIPFQKTDVLIKKYHSELKKYGYALMKLENGNLVVQRMKPSTVVMQDSNTYKNIYEISSSLIDAKLGLLAILLIGEICRDSTKNTAIKKALIKSGYIEKFKKLYFLIIK